MTLKVTLTFEVVLCSQDYRAGNSFMFKVCFFNIIIIVNIFFLSKLKDSFSRPMTFRCIMGQTPVVWGIKFLLYNTQKVIPKEADFNQPKFFKYKISDDRLRVSSKFPPYEFSMIDLYYVN